MCHKCRKQLARSNFSRLPDGSRRFYSWCDDCRADDKHPRVYVVLLNDEIGERMDARFPSVYVGQSVRPPEDRFLQHKAGIKKGKGYVFRFGERLMFRLFRNLPTFTNKFDVLAAEEALADALRAKGYTVYGGH